MSSHSRLVSLSLLFLAIPAYAQDAVRIVSYNIRMCKGQREMATPRIEVKLPFGIRIRVPSVPIPLQRPGQIGRIAKGLEALDADVICLQEVNDSSLQTLGRDQAKELSKRLGMKYVYAVAHREAKGVLKRQGNAVLSRHPILGQQVVELNPADGPHERRIAVFARIALPGHPEGVWVASLHAASDSDAIRMASMPRLMQAVQGLNGPVVLAGDFNASPGSPPMDELQRQGEEIGRSFVDAFAEVGEGPAETSMAPVGEARIDYILATPELEPVKAWSPRDLNESDHFAIVAEFRAGTAEEEEVASQEPPRLKLLGIAMD